MADLQVTWQGKQMLYYFLVQYANPAIRPWVHNVMFYNLFEDAGGAYNHQTFDVHRQYLLDRLQAKQPVGYFPETAYWVAFDVCVPLYLPLYVRSRWLDLHEVAKRGPPVRDHVLFSSGWEWGYWTHDALALQASYTQTQTWDVPLRQLWQAWGAAGKRMAERIVQLGDLQHQALIGQRLAPYLAGREAVIDLGFTAGVIARPDRVGFAALLAQTQTERAAFQASVLSPLQGIAGAVQTLADAELADMGDDPWLREVADGMAVTALRAGYVAALYQAVLQQAAGDKVGRDASLAVAEAKLAQAQVVVGRRHQALWDSPGGRATGRAANATLYPYGYLHQADTLCFWQRERTQVRNALLAAGDAVPGCIF